MKRSIYKYTQPMTEEMKAQFKKAQPMPCTFDNIEGSSTSTEDIKTSSLFIESKNKKSIVKKSSDFDIEKASSEVSVKCINGNRKNKTRQSYTKNQVIRLLEISLKGHGINPDKYNMEEYFKTLEDIMDGRKR